MDNASLLVIAMAERCRELIQLRNSADPGLPQSLHPTHLQWMCTQIERHSEDWTVAKLHRWIGFVQSAMLANGIVDFKAARAMFDQAKIAYGESSEDLVDHLDPASSFEVDIGGEG